MIRIEKMGFCNWLKEIVEFEEQQLFQKQGSLVSMYKSDIMYFLQGSVDGC